MNHLSDLAGVLPNGLYTRVARLFETAAGGEEACLGEWRKELERLLYHLSEAEGVAVPDTEGLVGKLQSKHVLTHDIAPYCLLWWRLSCLGAHFQQAGKLGGRWSEHLDMCRRAAALVLRWYSDRYPSLARVDGLREKLAAAAAQVTRVAPAAVVWPNLPIRDNLRREGVVVLHGHPWVGKTCLAGALVSEYAAAGYLPLVFHERDLIEPALLAEPGGEPDEDDPRRTSLLRMAGRLNELVVTRLFHGDNFIVLLDDPFGHRHLLHRGPLGVLGVNRWLALARAPGALGDLKVVITTPTRFLTEAVRVAAAGNSILTENLALLTEPRRVQLKLTDYDREGRARIVRDAAREFNCGWAEVDLVCDIVADHLGEVCPSFETLRTYCRATRTMGADDALDRVHLFEAAADVAAELAAAPDWVRALLGGVLVGEALVVLYREFRFQTRLTFADLCRLIPGSPPIDAPEVREELDRWVADDPASTFAGAQFPTFRHPHIRSAVLDRIKEHDTAALHDLLSRLCDWGGGGELARWESVHLVCRFAGVLLPADCDAIDANLFQASRFRGFDPRNVLWACVGNWHHIRQTALAQHARQAVRRLKDFVKYHRYLVWELALNWLDLDEDLRRVLLELTAESKSDDLRPVFNEHTTIAFLAAGFANFSAISWAARSGSPMSEKYLEFVQIFIQQLARKRGQPDFLSRPGDGLFDTPGVRYTGERILLELVELGERVGALEKNSPLAGQVRTLVDATAGAAPGR